MRVVTTFANVNGNLNDSDDSSDGIEEQPSLLMKNSIDDKKW